MKIDLVLYAHDSHEVLETKTDYKPGFNCLCGSDVVFPDAEMVSFNAYPDTNVLIVSYRKDKFPRL